MIVLSERFLHGESGNWQISTGRIYYIYIDIHPSWIYSENRCFPFSESVTKLIIFLLWLLHYSNVDKSKRWLTFSSNRNWRNRSPRGEFLLICAACNKHYLITRCVLTPAGPSANQLLLELPFLTTHRTEMPGLLWMQPLHDAVYMEAMWALAPD